MDIKELVEWVAKQIVKGMKEAMGFGHYKDEHWELMKDYEKQPYLEIAKQILSHPNLALVIRDGDEVPLGVEIETHSVVLLRKVLKEVKNV